MLVNLRNIFTRMDPTKQDMHTLHGVVMAIAEGRKGPAKGGVLDGEQATRLRALLAEQGQGGASADSSSTVRGLARLLRRNPTDAERILWQALTSDRRFAGQFKRQTPVGRHIPDFVSFVHRIAIELDKSRRERGDRRRPRRAEGVAGGARLSRDQHARRRRRGRSGRELDRLESSLAGMPLAGCCTAGRRAAMPDGLAAGLYQLTPIKGACLRYCQSPVLFLSRYWRPGAMGALNMGFRHGSYGVGCCWFLMALLFVSGVMKSGLDRRRRDLCRVREAVAS